MKPDAKVTSGPTFLRCRSGSSRLFLGIQSSLGTPHMIVMLGENGRFRELPRALRTRPTGWNRSRVVQALPIIHTPLPNRLSSQSMIPLTYPNSFGRHSACIYVAICTPLQLCHEIAESVIAFWHFVLTRPRVNRTSAYLVSSRTGHWFYPLPSVSTPSSRLPSLVLSHFII